MRTFLRALRMLPTDTPWHATVWSRRPAAPPATLGKVLGERVSFVDVSEYGEAEALALADVAVFASDGDRPTPGTLVRALGSGAFVVASRLPAYEEVLADGEHGLMFEPGEAQTLAAHLERLIARAAGSRPPGRRRAPAASES